MMKVLAAFHSARYFSTAVIMSEIISNSLFLDEGDKGFREAVRGEVESEKINKQIDA